MNTKILILILSSNRYPSPLNEYSQKKTWIKDAEAAGIDVLFYKAGKKTKLRNKYLYVEQKDKSVVGITEKTLKAFDWVSKNRDYDLIFRINSSSYINIDNFIKFISQIKIEKLYSGKVMNFHGNDYVSGAGILISKDLVKLIINQKENINKDYLDDVAFGDLLNNQNIEINKSGYQYFSDNIYRQEIDTTQYQYRCNLYYFGYPRYLEIFVFRKIQRALLNKSDNSIDTLIKPLMDLLKKLNFNYFYLKNIAKSNKVYRN